MSHDGLLAALTQIKSAPEVRPVGVPYNTYALDSD